MTHRSPSIKMRYNTRTQMQDEASAIVAAPADVMDYTPTHTSTATIGANAQEIPSPDTTESDFDDVIAIAETNAKTPPLSSLYSSSKHPIGSEADLLARANSIEAESQPSSFYSLPRELRDMIYELATIDTTIIHPVCYGRHPAHDCPLIIRTYGALLATSRDVRAEVVDAFSKRLRKGGNLFVVENSGFPLINSPSGAQDMEVVAGFEREVWTGKGPDERDLKGRVGVRVRESGCSCASMMHSMVAFEIQVHRWLRARIYQKGSRRSWRAKWIVPRSRQQEFEKRKNQAWKPGPRLLAIVEQGEELLEKFRTEVEREDGLKEIAMLKFLAQMNRVVKRAMRG